MATVRMLPTPTIPTVIDHMKSDTVTRIAKEQTTYDNASNVTQKIIAGVTTNYQYDDIDQLTQEAVVSGTTTNYTYDANGNRATKAIVGGITETYTNDDADKLTSVSVGGSTTKSYTYDANGKTHIVSWDAFGNALSASGTQVGPFGFAGAWRYQSDNQSGLLLLGHRYYDASTGCLFSRDSAKEDRNWYVYVNNNPIRFVDPDGNRLRSTVGGIATFVWEFPQIMIGYLYSTASGGGYDTTYDRDADDTEHVKGPPNTDYHITFGPVMIHPPGAKPMPIRTRKHEEGHQIQSKILGPLYLPAILLGYSSNPGVVWNPMKGKNLAQAIHESSIFE